MNLFRSTFSQLLSDKAMRLSAALAYYTILSLAPLLLIVIAIAGFAFGEEAARGGIVTQMRGLMGDTGAKALEEIVRNASQSDGKATASIVGLIMLLVGASGVFVQLQDSLNTIWGVEPKPDRGIKNIIRQRFMSFGMTLAVGFLLLVSLVVSAGLAAAGKYFSDRIPLPPWGMEAINLGVSFLIITGVFALLFKFLPDARVRWGDVWEGAAMSSALFVVGKFALGFYLGRGAVSSAYGAAGSLVILLIWVYYSSLILFFGAEFAQVWASRHGHSIKPAPYARISDTEKHLEPETPPRRRPDSGPGRFRPAAG